MQKIKEGGGDIEIQMATLALGVRWMKQLRCGLDAEEKVMRWPFRERILEKSPISTALAVAVSEFHRVNRCNFN